MDVIKTVHVGQFKIKQNEVEEGKKSFNGEILINRERFSSIVDLHNNIYKDKSSFWDMLERDLFDESK